MKTTTIKLLILFSLRDILNSVGEDYLVINSMGDITEDNQDYLLRYTPEDCLDDFSQALVYFV